jgi:hypothetical protein
MDRAEKKGTAKISRAKSLKRNPNRRKERKETGEHTQQKE